MRSPGIDPAEGLRETGMVAEVVRVLDIGEECGALGGVGNGCGQRGFDSDEVSADRIVKAFPSGGRRPIGVGGSDASDDGSGTERA